MNKLKSAALSTFQILPGLSCGKADICISPHPQYQKVRKTALSQTAKPEFLQLYIL